MTVLCVPGIMHVRCCAPVVLIKRHLLWVAHRQRLTVLFIPRP